MYIHTIHFQSTTPFSHVYMIQLIQPHMLFVIVVTFALFLAFLKIVLIFFSLSSKWPHNTAFPRWIWKWNNNNNSAQFCVGFVGGCCQSVFNYFLRFDFNDQWSPIVAKISTFTKITSEHYDPKIEWSNKFCNFLQPRFAKNQ